MKVVLRTHFRFESAAVPVPFPSALPLLQQLDDRITDLLVRVAFGEVFADILPLEFKLLLLVWLLLGEDVVNRLVLQHPLLRELFKPYALCVRGCAVVELHCV